MTTCTLSSASWLVLPSAAQPGSSGTSAMNASSSHHAIQAAQVVAVGMRRLGLLQHVQDRLVVLVHQHHDPLAGLPVQGFQQIREAAGCRQVVGYYSQAPFAPASCSMTLASSASGPAKLPPPNLSRTTGWRSDQSWRSWMYSPANSSSLPSNSSFSVSRGRLLPNPRGRDRK